MGAELVIRDGDPWWLSPDIWVVPGDDPSGPPGAPAAGHPNHLWARVVNTGDLAVRAVRVNFYWANPATEVLRRTATLVGSSFVDLNAGETKEVLCVTLWAATVVNGGHECVLAEAIHLADPLPATDAFDPPLHRQVAQRNLQVVEETQAQHLVVMPIQITAHARFGKAVVVSAETPPHGLPEAEEQLRSVGLGKVRPAKQPLVAVGLSAEPSCQLPESEHASMRLEVAGGTSRAIHLVARWHGHAASGYQAVHIIERDGDKVLGGTTVIFVGRQRREAR